MPISIILISIFVCSEKLSIQQAMDFLLELSPLPLINKALKLHMFILSQAILRREQLISIQQPIMLPALFPMQIAGPLQHLQEDLDLLA